VARDSIGAALQPVMDQRTSDRSQELNSAKSYRHVRHVISTLVGVAMVALSGWNAWAASPADPACTADQNLRLIVGGQLFAVPRAYLPNIYSGSVILQNPICQGSLDPPIASEHFSIHVGDQAYFRADALTRPIWHVRVEIRSRQLPYRRSEEVYRDALRYIEAQGVRLDELPRKHGFIAYDGEGHMLIYIALPGTIATLDDAPFILECSARGVWSPDPTTRGQWIYIGRPCYTSYYTFSDAVVGRYKFDDGEHPPSTWKALDMEVRRFVRSMQDGNIPSKF